jgi:hypothetical protein
MLIFYFIQLTSGITCIALWRLDLPFLGKSNMYSSFKQQQEFGPNAPALSFAEKTVSIWPLAAKQTFSAVFYMTSGSSWRLGISSSENIDRE